MKKIIIACLAFFLIVVIALLPFLLPPKEYPADYGPAILRGTIVHTAQIDEGHLVYVSSPDWSDLLYIFLITEESDVEQALMNMIQYGFSGDYIEVVANTEAELVAGQYVRLVETMKLYEKSE